jgi:hypothetical protein
LERLVAGVPKPECAAFMISVDVTRRKINLTGIIGKQYSRAFLRYQYHIMPGMAVSWHFLPGRHIDYQGLEIPTTRHGFFNNVLIAVFFKRSQVELIYDHGIHRFVFGYHLTPHVVNISQVIGTSSCSLSSM